jgi:hypothetical protein
MEDIIICKSTGSTGRSISIFSHAMMQNWSSRIRDISSCQNVQFLGAERDFERVLSCSDDIDHQRSHPRQLEGIWIPNRVNMDQNRSKSTKPAIFGIFDMRFLFSSIVCENIANFSDK